MAEDEGHWNYELPHVRNEALRERATYEYPSRPQERVARRADHHAHSVALLGKLTEALGAIPAQNARMAIQRKPVSKFTPSGSRFPTRLWCSCTQAPRP